MDDLHVVLDDADWHDLLTVAAMHHERVGEGLNAAALRLAEALGQVAPCQEHVVLHQRHR